MTVTPREDLLIEVDTTLDGSGNYASDWLDSAEIHSVRLVFGFASGSGSVYVSPSNDTTYSFPTLAVSSGSEVAIASRYFQVVATGTASTAFHLAVRKAS